MKNRLIPVVFMTVLVFASMISGCKNKNDGDKDPADLSEPVETVEVTESYRDDFAGAWTDQTTGAMLDIWKSEDGIFHALACVKTDETKVSYWSFTAPAQEGKLEYTDCERIDAVYGSNGQISEETVYERGRGRVEFDGDNLIWYDATDNAGEGLVFAYEGGY